MQARRVPIEKCSPRGELRTPRARGVQFLLAVGPISRTVYTVG